MKSQHQGKDSSYLTYSDRKKLHGVRVSPKLSEWIGSTCFNEDFVKNYNKVTMLVILEADTNLPEQWICRIYLF